MGQEETIFTSRLGIRMNIHILDKPFIGALNRGGMGFNLSSNVVEIWRAYHRDGKRYSVRDWERSISRDLTHESIHSAIKTVAGNDASIMFDNLFRDGRGWIVKKIKLLRSWGLA